MRRWNADTQNPGPNLPDRLPVPLGHGDGVWLKGDWHMHCRHSTDSSNNPVRKIIGFAEAQNYDYLVITDHDVHVAGAVAEHTWADPEYRSNAVMLFYGAELTAPRGHVNFFSPEPYDHQRIFDARDARDWTLQALAEELGVHLSANHPNKSNHYSYSFDIAQSIEVWNTSQWEVNLPNMRIWDDLLLSGRMLGARGGSDSHHGRPDSPELATDLSYEAEGNYVGTPTTWIYAAERSKEAILVALEQGRASISANPNNPRVELYASLDGGESFTLMMGDNAVPTGGEVVFEVRLEGGCFDGVAYGVRVVKDRSEFGQFYTDPASHSLRFTDTPDPTQRSYYRVEVMGPQTPFPEVPLCMSQSGIMVAISNPIYFNYDPDF